MAEQWYKPPGAVNAVKSQRYENTPTPILQWTAAREPWGPMTYAVSVDGTQVANTRATAVRVPTPVADGPHHWQVFGTNPAGQSTSAAGGAVFVDTVPPTGVMTLSGRPVVGSTLQLHVTYVDLPPVGEPPTDASGVANVVVRWGDGTVVPLMLGSHRSFHAYNRPGHYMLSLLVTDRAGNSTRELIRVTVVKPKPKPKPKPKGHSPKPTSHTKGKSK
jgi:hypothetical protein